MPIAFVIAFATLGERLPRQTFICSTRMTLQEPITLLVTGGIPKGILGALPPCAELLGGHSAAISCEHQADGRRCSPHPA